MPEKIPESENSQPYLSVIIPAYNEERRLKPTLESVCAYLTTQPWESEVIIVSDGSADRTVDVAKKFQERYQKPMVKVLENQINRGKGFVVKQGMLLARGQLRLFMDADNSTPIDELPVLLKHLKQPGLSTTQNSAPRYDVVIGSLAVDGSSVNKRQFIMRVVAGKIGNIIIQTLLLPGIHDTQRGFKIFTEAAANKIFAKQSVDRWGFDIEILTLARQYGFTIKEAPVKWSHDASSKVSTWSYLQVLGEVIKIRWHLGRVGTSLSHLAFCQQYLPARGKILDDGSGRGKFICEAAAAGYQAYGIELNPAYIQNTLELASQTGVTVQVTAGVAEHLPYENNFFDFVNCAEVTEHVTSPAEVCREIYRVLKPGGHGYLSFHNRYGWYDYHYKLPGINWLPRSVAERVASFLGRARLDSPDIGRQTLTNMHYFTYSSVLKLLGDCGFRTVDIREEKLRKMFPRVTLFTLGLYRQIFRPVYFNTFHLLVSKPKV